MVAAESIFIRQSHFEHVISLAEACRSETCWIIAEGEAEILVPDTGFYRQAKTQVAGSIVLEIRGPMVGIPEPEDICSRGYDRAIAVPLCCQSNSRKVSAFMVYQSKSHLEHGDRRTPLPIITLFRNNLSSRLIIHFPIICAKRLFDVFHQLDDEV